MSSVISDKISDFLNQTEKDLESCNNDLIKLSDSKSQVTSLCNSVSAYLKNVSAGISSVEKVEDQANILLNSVNELLQFSEKYPQEINNSFSVLYARKEVHESNIQKLGVLYTEIKNIEKEQEKIMSELELGNTASRKKKKPRRKPGERPDNLKKERSSLPNVEEEDGEIALEDI